MGRVLPESFEPGRYACPTHGVMARAVVAVGDVALCPICRAPLLRTVVDERDDRPPRRESRPQ